MRNAVKKTMIQLTILIPTIPQRTDQFNELTKLLNGMCKNRAKVLSLYDNKQMSVGAKRNKLMQMVDTPYLTFFDDDDEPHPQYVDVIIRNIEQYPDIECFGMTGYQSIDGKYYGAYDFDIKHYKNFNPRVIENGVRIQTCVRLPNHICVWKTDVARRVPFRDKSLGEDHDWGFMQQTAGYKFRKLETDLQLYHYKFSKTGTQTRLR